MNDGTAYELFDIINQRLTDIQARSLATTGCVLRACAHIQQRPLKEVVSVYEELQKKFNDMLSGAPMVGRINFIEFLEPEEPKPNGN